MLIYHFGSKDSLFQAILRAARSRERFRSAGALSSGSAQPPRDLQTGLRQTWKYLAAPREHPFWRFYFEIHGLALQNPERYPDVLREGVHDWLVTIRQPLIEAGMPKPRADAIATLVLAAFRGLILDLLQTRERKRIDRAFELLVWAAEKLTRMPPERGETKPRQTGRQVRASQAPA